MWSVALYDMGLTPEEFYALTPRQYHALVKRKEHETTTWDALFARLEAVTANFSMCRPQDKWFQPSDFMATHKGKTKPDPNAPRRRRITPKLQKENTLKWRSIFAGMAQLARKG
jgi:hypothetical protein